MRLTQKFRAPISATYKTIARLLTINPKVNNFIVYELIYISSHYNIIAFKFIRMTFFKNINEMARLFSRAKC
jgi:hypothetical protein